MSAHPLRLWYLAETGAEPDGPATCWLCAGPTPDAGPTPAEVAGVIHHDLARLAKHVFSGNFTDHDRGRGTGDVVCPACAAYFAYTLPEYRGRGGAAGKLFGVHMRCMASGWRTWDRAEMADDLLGWHRDGLPENAALTITYSRKKHTLPWARVNLAGERRPWIRFDAAEARVPPDLPALVAAMADLWARGYGKTLLADGVLHPATLAQSDDPVADLAHVALIARHVGSPIPDLISYIVTEDNRERHARELAPLLPRPRPLPTAGGTSAGDRERGGRPAVQEPVPAPVVADPRGAREARRADRREPGGVEQLGLL